MNREDILNYLKKYNLNSEEYIVISGAAMVLYGMKQETTDIDIAVSKEYYDELLKKYPCVFERNTPSCDAYLIDEVVNFATNYYSKNRNLIENFPVQTIEELITLKESLKREKDKKDLILIRRYKNERN